MPSLGSDMERAILIEWLVPPGTEVARGDIIAVVETDKGAIEIEVFESGRLSRYLVETDTEVEVGAPLAEIEVPGDTPAPAATELLSKTPPIPAAATTQPTGATTPAQPAATARPADATRRISPAARSLAARLQIDLTRVPGSGPDGTVVYNDVQAYATASAADAAKPAETPAASDMRRAIAAAMTRSKREIPHYYLSTCVDIEDTMDWLMEVNASKAPAERVLAFALFVKATAQALSKHPQFNGFFESDNFQPSEAIHTGVAIAIRGGGLVAPAIHNANSVSLFELMAKLRDLTGRVRQGRYRMSELRDPTVTITSLGDRGVEHITGVIYPPQVACIGFGKVVDQPWSMPDRSVVSRQTVNISLAADHRVSDGRQGGLLLSSIAAALQDPQNL